MPNNDSHQHVVKTSAQWNDRAVEYWVVPRGCLCVELTSRGKTKLKVGEGNKYYAQLPYICDIEDLSDYYTKEEINNLFNNLNRMAIMSTEEYDEKSDLPLTGNKLGDVRFVKSSSPSLKLDPDVYLWNGHKWIFVGYDIIDIDLSQYIKREEFEPVAAKVDEMYPKMHTHENKETLDRIEEPYTTAEKDKLDSLENYDDTEIRALIRQATHVHPNKSILDQIQQPFKNADKEKLDSLENYDDTELRDRISDVEAVAHTHSNKDELDSIYSGFVDEHQVLVEFKTVAEEEIDDLNNDVADLKTKIHTHSNKNILDSTTAPYTTQDKATLDELAAITIFDGASPTYDGFRGYVPAPLAGQESYFLRGDGTWAKVKQGGDKYKAGDGIFILSGEVISDTFPFKAYSKSGHLSQYIIYGNTGGVGESMGGGTYGVNISVTDEHGNTSNTSIILPEKISFGDYIDYEKQVFVHMRTNVSSLVNTVDPNYRYRWAIRSNGDIASTDLGAYGSSPQVTTLVELEPGTTYELYHECSYSAFSNYMNLNVYDVDQNRTRTMNFYDSTGKVPTIIALGSNEKYIRLTWEHCDWYPNTLIKVKAVETPITLPQIPLFPNSINTINVTNTIKPAEIYVEVAEPSEDDPEDPMSEYTGIIYNDGVLDVTQDDPDNLNIITFHYRDNVTKDITINTGIDECVVDITQEDPDNLNELTVSYADGTSTVITIPGGGGSSETYVAGDGIMISDGASSFELNENNVTNTEYFFDTQVTSNISGRIFTKYTTEPALGAVVYYGYTQPFFVGLTADSVKYGTNYDSHIWPDPGHPPFEYKGVTWYYSDNAYGMPGDVTDSSGHMQKLPGNYSVATEADLQNIARAIIDAADIIISPAKTISAKLGSGLQFDSNNAIELDKATTETIGGVIVGDGLNIDENGVLSINSSSTGEYEAGDAIRFTKHTPEILPAEYQLVDYIQSTGEQGIELNYIPASSYIKYELTFSDIEFVVNDDFHYLIGGWASAVDMRPPSIAYNFVLWPNKVDVPCGRTDTIKNGEVPSDMTVPHTYTLTVSNGSISLQLDNGVVRTSSYSGDISQKVGLFCAPSNVAGDPSAIFQTAAYRFRELKIYEGNSSSNLTLIHHYYPCYRISDDEPGIYDVITDTFLTNIGTGDLIIGPITGTPAINVQYGEGLEVDNNNDLNVKLGDGLYFDADGAIAASGDNDYTAGEGIDITGATRPIDINYIRLDINNSRDNGRGHIIQFKNIRVLDTNSNSLQFSHASSVYGDGSVVEYGQNSRDESPQAMIEGRNKTCCTNFSLTKAPLKITFTLTSETSIANITAFSILTGADYTERDPVSWDIYASNDGMTWYKIQEAHSPDVTTARSTWITNIPFVIPPDAVEVLPGVKTIKAKIGTGLTFDSNDAIELDDSIKLRLNCNNEPN